MYELCCPYSDHSTLHFYFISVFLHTVLYLLKNDSLLQILRFPGYFETPLFRTFFDFPWDFEIAGYNCICFVNSSVIQPFCILLQWVLINCHYFRDVTFEFLSLVTYLTNSLKRKPARFGHINSKMYWNCTILGKLLNLWHPCRWLPHPC